MSEIGPIRMDVEAVLSGEGARRKEFDLVETMDPHERYYARRDTALPGTER